MSNWRDDLSESARQFSEIVYPAIKSKWFTGADLAPVEHVSSEDFAERLDDLAGVDYWVVDSSTGMRGLASRVQSQRDWSTFTVRHSRPSGAETEFQKRRRAISEDYLYPYWTVQAYVTDGKLQNAAVCRTEDLIEYIEFGTLGIHYSERESYSGEKFYVVHWHDFQNEFEVSCYDEPDNRVALA